LLSNSLLNNTSITDFKFIFNLTPKYILNNPLLTYIFDYYKQNKIKIDEDLYPPNTKIYIYDVLSHIIFNCLKKITLILIL